MNAELESLACAFHGALTAGHAFAAYFNARRGRWWWVAFHLAGVALDARAVVAHAREIKSR